MEPSTLIKQNVEFYVRRSKAKTVTIKCISAIKEGLDAVDSTQADVTGRKTIRRPFLDCNDCQRGKCKKTGEEKERIKQECARKEKQT